MQPRNRATDVLLGPATASSLMLYAASTPKLGLTRPTLAMAL